MAWGSQLDLAGLESILHNNGYPGRNIQQALQVLIEAQGSGAHSSFSFHGISQESVAQETLCVDGSEVIGSRTHMTVLLKRYPAFECGVVSRKRAPQNSIQQPAVRDRTGIVILLAQAVAGVVVASQ